MKKERLFFTIPVIACALLLAACGSGGSNDAVVEETAQGEIIDEGVDTEIEITEYSMYNGPHKERFLKKGDRIAVISPSALPSREQADAVINGLKEWGYEPVEGKYVCTDPRTLENCKEDLEWALTDPTIKAIFCVRGGYAASDVMDIMPQGLISGSGKIIIGYSDISVYHSAWTAEGLPSVHSSMSSTFMDLPEECKEPTERMLKGELPVYKCAASGFDKQGSAEGILIGGNLSTIMTSINTWYDSTNTDKPYILFLEEVDMENMFVHRCLTVLKHKGVLDNAAGIVFGEWVDYNTYCEEFSGSSRGGVFSSVMDMISKGFTDELDIPVAFGFPAGHGEKNYPLLMGEQVKLDVGQDGYTLEWVNTEKQAGGN